MVYDFFSRRAFLTSAGPGLAAVNTAVYFGCRLHNTVYDIIVIGADKAGMAEAVTAVEARASDV